MNPLIQLKTLTLSVVALSLSSDLGEQLGADSFVLGQDSVRPAQRIGRARRDIRQVPDGRRDDVKSGGQGVVHQVRQ